MSTPRPHKWGGFGHEPTGLTPHGGNFPGPYPVPGRFGVDRPIDDQRIGNEVKLRGVQVGTETTTHTPDLTDQKRLLDVSLQQIAAATGKSDAQWVPGSWVLAIEAFVTGKWTATAAPGPQPFAVCPLLARIRMGIGGAEVIVEVSPFPSASIQLPCDRVIVEVGWDPYRPQQYGQTAGKLILPDELTVRATIQRGNGVGDARRTFLAFDPNGIGFDGDIPPFAQSVMPYNASDAAVYNAGAVFDQFATDVNDVVGAGFTTITLYTGAQMQGIKNAGERLDCPGAARRWRYDSGAAALATPLFVDFAVGI
jgi:hypothetical protein